MTHEIDPITFSVIWGGVVAAAAEIGTTLTCTAYSTAVREGSDFSTGMFDAEGNMVSQGDYSPGHLGSMAYTVKKMLEYYPIEELSPGDAIICNDPAIGSGHLPDVFQVCPIFHADILIGFAVNIAHQIDIGGGAVGGQQVQGVRSMFQEGLRLMPVRLFHKGEPCRDIMRIIEANVRVPEVIGDMRAQYIANQAGGARLIALAKQYGVPTLHQALSQICGQTESAMRAAINELRPGTYHFQDQLDDVGPGTDPVLAKVAVTIGDGHVHADWTGSGPQREAGLNAYISYTNAYTLAAVKSVTLPLIPQNAGVTRVVSTYAPAGSFFNPRHPAPCGGRATVSHRIYETIMGALAQAVPDRVIAANSHFFNPNIGIPSPRTGRLSIVWETIIGGIGARADADGVEAMASPWNGTNMPVELQEFLCPILVERVGFIPDSSGPGRFRGGSGLRKEIRMLAPGGALTNLGDRHITPPYGLDGGKPGQLGRTILNPGTQGEQVLHAKGNYDLAEGDLISWQTAGAGGVGNPLLRDPQRVLDDVLDGFVTVAGARRDYAVVIDTTCMAVDAMATRALREALAG
jgi:N-methylhydantoinase B